MYPLRFKRSPAFWIFPQINYRLCCNSDKKQNQPSLTPVARSESYRPRLERSLHEEEAGADELGNLLLRLHEARQHVGYVHRSFVESFSKTLSEEQRRRLRSVFQAAEMQRILPVFKQVGLLP